ncbi:MAG: preprotein translocase subunit SecE [Acidobacteriota bacterium]|jgi:preprotein translocase subunit SecE
MSEVVTANKAAGFPDRVREYIDGLRDEMRLVTWPSWNQVRATTAVVIAAVFIFAGYFAVVDQVVGISMEKLFSTFSK